MRREERIAFNGFALKGFAVDGKAFAPAGNAHRKAAAAQAAGGNYNPSAVGIIGFLRYFYALKLCLGLKIMVNENRIFIVGIKEIADRSNKPCDIRRAAGAVKNFNSLREQIILALIVFLVFSVSFKVDFKRIYIKERFAVKRNARQSAVVYCDFGNIGIDRIGVEQAHSSCKKSKTYRSAGFGICNIIRQVVILRKSLAVSG